ncbi:MAG TPA: PQQ-binding-like beta-propeller repeat protein [Steroidobacteraceae bacterium]|nr:PQQ-binding-like beta-propeller repeat protein [Steroidobacteraceae bacterium]
MAAVALTATAAIAASPDAAIKPAPAFKPAQLTALPTNAWITNGGNLYNQRYSPLTLINRDNVKGLKGLWRTGMGSGAGPGNAGQAQILAYEGTLYVVNGASDVFAMDVETGRTLWSYRGNPNPKGGSPIGKVSRGVALGEGKVFVGHTDAQLAALDQRTGNVIWKIAAEDWQQGYAITAAPLYYDGLVIIGFNGGEMGTRGRLKAFDAKTGKLRWTFYTVPAPGEPGHETWPQDNDAWTRGGAGIWQTPAIDPELGLVYFTTGNPGPDLNGGVRKGDNLFSVSVVAIEAKTGKYRWHFQQVHHDIWDYDSPNPVVLFDAPYDGKMRKGIVEVSKTGWAYILDRETGKPLIGIEEKPVPQEPRQATSATQPYPIGDAIVPQAVDIVPEGVRVDAHGDVPNKGRIFTPFWTDPIVVKPGTMGGANWPPSSYDPESHLLYVCASDRISTFWVREPLETPGPNKVYMGGAFGQADVDDAGVFAALDVRTNKLAWRQQWREICYSGSVVTAGGLVFVGRADGRLTALDKSNGSKLWEFMTDAGVNSTVTTFEHKGKQYVVVHAGGGVFANGKQGDGIWMFSLDGQMNPVPPPPPPGARPAGGAGSGPGAGGAGAGGRPAGGGPQPGAGAPPAGAPAAAGPGPGVGAGGSARPVNRANGEKIYNAACVPCHGESGAGGHGGGPSLIAGQDVTKIVSLTASGKNNMPSFAATYSIDDMRDIADYVTQGLAAAAKK